MKYGLLVCSPAFVYKNIGDYIQSVAQEQFLPTVDEIVEREALNVFMSKGGDKIKVIMNGWFMWHPECFPPSHDLCPLFISFHLTPKIESAFFNEDTINYLKHLKEQ